MSFTLKVTKKSSKSKSMILAGGCSSQHPESVSVLVCYLQSPSGMSSRLLLAAMNSVRLESFPTPGGTPSKSSLFEFTYSFFSLDSLQIADWKKKNKCYTS